MARRDWRIMALNPTADELEQNMRMSRVTFLLLFTSWYLAHSTKWPTQWLPGYMFSWYIVLKFWLRNIFVMTENKVKAWRKSRVYFLLIRKQSAMCWIINLEYTNLVKNTFHLTLILNRTLNLLGLLTVNLTLNLYLLKNNQKTAFIHRWLQETHHRNRWASTVRVHYEHIEWWSERTRHTRRSGTSVCTANWTRTVHGPYGRPLKLPMRARQKYSLN